MSRPYYLWKGGDVLICNDWSSASQEDNYFVFDPVENEADDRWGVIVKGRWWPRDVDSIPAEFKTKLLILGAFQ